VKTDKLRHYPKGYHRNNGSYKKFEGDFESINYNDVQPLKEEQKHFFDCIQQNNRPLTDGMHGLEVLEILAQAQKRLRDYSNHNCSSHKSADSAYHLTPSIHEVDP